MRVCGPWVIKVTNIGFSRAFTAAKNELLVLDRLVHRGVRTGKFSVHSGNLYIFTRACFRERRCALSIAAYTHQLAEDIKRLHDAGVFHLDIKEANLVVCAPCEVQLVDFGLSRTEDQVGTEYEEDGTRSHMPAGLCGLVRSGAVPIRQAYAYRDVFAAFVTVVRRMDPRATEWFETARDGVRYRRRPGADAPPWPASIVAFFEKGDIVTDVRALSAASCEM